MSTTLQQLCDERDIREVLTRYCRATDRLDAEMLKSVYWPDATDQHVIFNGNAWEYVDFAIPMLREHTKATQHLMANCLIQLEGDVALTETYCQCYHLMSGEEKVEVIVGARWLDRLERRNGEWRIAERSCIIDWEQNGGGMMSPEEISKVSAPEKRSTGDAGYRLFANKTLK